MNSETAEQMLAAQFSKKETCQFRENRTCYATEYLVVCRSYDCNAMDERGIPKFATMEMIQERKKRLGGTTNGN